MDEKIHLSTKLNNMDDFSDGVLNDDPSTNSNIESNSLA